MKICLLMLFIISFLNFYYAQQIPSLESNIEYLVTYGKDASLEMGDDDYSQVFFITIPESYKNKFYVRVFSPAANSKDDVLIDQNNSLFNYSVYGGQEAINNFSKNVNPILGFNKGELLYSESFGNSADTSWAALGPFNPKDGALSTSISGNKERVFKVICSGVSGDDGNLYKYYVSQEEASNKKIEASNSYTYECSFRMKTKTKEKVYFFPYITDNISKIQVHNFDFDDDGSIRFFSNKKDGFLIQNSGDGFWSSTSINIVTEEKNRTAEIVFTKLGDWHNDLTFYLLNQEEKGIALYSMPIGRRPVSSTEIIINYR